MSEVLPKGIRTFLRQGFVTKSGLEFHTLEDAVRQQELEDLSGFLALHPDIDWREACPVDVAKTLLDNFDIKRKET